MPPVSIARLNYHSAEANANPLCVPGTHEDDASHFAFNTQQLLVSSSHELERVSCVGNCWSSQEGSSAAALSVDGYKLPDGTTGSPTHSGPRESDPQRGVVPRK